MAKYKVWVYLEAEYDDIEADNEEEAFIVASDCAMNGGACWQYNVEKVDDEEKICPCDNCEEQYDCGDCDYRYKGE